ncbi:MAG: HupE/UreJ family protein [Betaproteobacteria bacterium]
MIVLSPGYSWKHLAVLLGAFLFAPIHVAHAHKPSDSYLTLTPHDALIDVHWDVALRDLDNELGLDADDDGALTWGEVRTRQRDIEAFLLPQLRIKSGTERCSLVGRTGATAAVHRLASHSDGTYAALDFSLDCKSPPQAIEVEYRLFATSDPTHRGILRIDATGLTTASPRNGADRTAVLGPEQPIRTFELQPASRWATLREFVKEGIRHILLGFDHILFLLALLLTSVLVRGSRNGKPAWQGAPQLRLALSDVVKMVTAFTVAHSLTLSLAVFDVVSLPSRVVESAIALTIVLAAVNNLTPILRERLWIAAFGFGLIHGFGFAGALRDLGLPRDALAISLFGFNLGVEIGQLGIVLAFFPIAYAKRFTAFYRRGVVWFGSATIGALAAVWFIERALDLKLLGPL